MQKTISNILSYAFHPLLMPTYGLFIFFKTNAFMSFIPMEAQYLLYLIVFAGTFLLPILFMPFFIYKKLIIKFSLEGRAERIIPLIITTLAYYFTYYVINMLPLPPMIPKFFFASALAVVLTLIVTLYWKISAHLVGLGGLVGCVIAISIKTTIDYHYLIIGLILLSGVLGYARLTLKAHTTKQVYAGFALGLAIMLVGMFVF